MNFKGFAALVIVYREKKDEDKKLKLSSTK